MEAFRQQAQIVEVSKAGGSSAGALVAAAMLTGLPMESVMVQVVQPNGKSSKICVAQFERMMNEVGKHKLGALSPSFHLGRVLEVKSCTGIIQDKNGFEEEKFLDLSKKLFEEANSSIIETGVIALSLAH